MGGDDADAAHLGGVGGDEDLLGGSAHPVGGAAHAAVGQGDDGLLVAGREDSLGELLGAIHHAAGAVDPEQNRVDLRVLEGSLEVLLGEGAGGHSAEAVPGAVGLGDDALDGDDGHAILQLVGLPVGSGRSASGSLPGLEIELLAASVSEVEVADFLEPGLGQGPGRGEDVEDAHQDSFRAAAMRASRLAPRPWVGAGALGSALGSAEGSGATWVV